MGYQAIDSLFYLEDYAALCQTRINRTAVRHRLPKNNSNRGPASPTKINQTVVRHRLPASELSEFG